MSQIVRPKILIISASIGGGHVAAACALEEAFADYPCDVEHIDLLDFTSRAFRRLFRDTYLRLLKSVPDFVDWFGKRLDKDIPKNRQHRLLKHLVRVASPRLARYIKRFRPDLVVHTHFLPPVLISKRDKERIVEAVVVTDYGAHSLWLSKGIKHYFVATKEIAVHLCSLGVSHEKVRVRGIPIAKSYQRLVKQSAACSALKILNDKVVLLIVSDMDKATVSTLLAQIKDIKIALTVVIICGRSTKLIGYIQKILANYQGSIDFRLMGFIKELPYYMAAANILVGKPGGLTSSEALAAGLPFAVVTPHPLQEEANSNFLLENGAGMRIEPLSVFGYKLECFFNDQKKQHRMQEAAKELAKVYAANEIAKDLYEEISPCK